MARDEHLQTPEEVLPRTLCLHVSFHLVIIGTMLRPARGKVILGVASNPLARWKQHSTRALSSEDRAYFTDRNSLEEYC
jgi:hypothetical protein